MTEASAKYGMNPALLAKLTGGLGDQKSIAKLCAEFGQLYTEFLPDVFKSETGLTVSVGYTGCETGLMSDLIADLGDDIAVANASLRNWCPHYVLTCGNNFIITLMENLLGASPDSIEEPIERPLSRIELDLATMVFDKIGSVLRSGVGATGGFEAAIQRPRNVEDRVSPAGEADEFAAAFKLTIGIGSVVGEFALVVPQKTLLKTNVTLPKSRNQAPKVQKDWGDQIGEQVRRSHVTLQARIRLDSLTLRTISKLAVGDVIPFQDKEDVQVDISANGKDMYVCELGRAGANYMVRVTDNVSTEDEILRHLMG